MESRVEARNVSMYPSDWADVDKKSLAMNIRSTSATLRVILQEWRELKAAQEPVQECAPA